MAPAQSKLVETQASLLTKLRTLLVNRRRAGTRLDLLAALPLMIALYAIKNKVQSIVADKKRRRECSPL